MNPKNGCGECGADFTSVSLFDRHRVGVHTYTHSEGLKMEPMRDDGRRCLDPDEMRAKGWGRDAKGRWHDPVTVAKARIAFSQADTTPQASLEAQPDALERPGSPRSGDVVDLPSQNALGRSAR